MMPAISTPKLKTSWPRRFDTQLTFLSYPVLSSKRNLIMITLYDCSTAPNPRRARIFLAEKGVAHETIQVDLRNSEQLSGAYQKINPLCTVPALRTEDGAILTDNAAITAYLEARYPAPPLLGTTPDEKAQIASWNWRVEFEGLMAVAEALRSISPTTTAPRPRSPRWNG